MRLVVVWHSMDGDHICSIHFLGEVDDDERSVCDTVRSLLLNSAMPSSYGWALLERRQFDRVHNLCWFRIHYLTSQHNSNFSPPNLAPANPFELILDIMD